MLKAYINNKEFKDTKNIELFGELEDLNHSNKIALERIPNDVGVYKCKVIFNNNKYQANLYLWLDKELDWHGIVVKQDDVNLKEAKTLYEYKRRIDNYTYEELQKICPRSDIAELCDDKSEYNCKACNWWNDVWHP